MYVKFHNFALELGALAMNVLRIILLYFISLTSELVAKNMTVNNKIISGRAASITEFPHYAMIQCQYQDARGILWSPCCGGSVIHNNWVLTAAHCFETSNDEILIMRILVGIESWNLRTSYDQHAYYISAIYVLPETDTKVPVPRHDLALVKLDRPIQFNKKVNKILLYPDNHEPLELKNYPTEIVGFGRTRHNLRSPSAYLKHARLNVVTRRACEYRIGKNKICTSSGTGTPCMGDSGGGLIARIGRTNYIAGILSYGSVSCDDPSVFFRVSYYSKWIKKVMKRNGDTFSKN